MPTERATMSIKIKELSKTKLKHIAVTPRFLMQAMRQQILEQPETLERTLDVIANMTEVSGRENVARIYASFPSKRDTDLDLSRRIVRLDIGTKDTAPTPELKDRRYFSAEGKSYRDEYRRMYEGNDLILFLPIFNIHSHTRRGMCVPSLGDLKNAHYYYEQNHQIGRSSVAALNKEIFVIDKLEQRTFGNCALSDSYFFFQYTGNEKRYERLVKSYPSMLEEIYAKNATPQTLRRFAHLLDQSGAFKALYFGPGELIVQNTTKMPFIEAKKRYRIAEKFAYTIHVKKN